ncbi:hypothetical protein [Glutamicibacter arilaitensis]|uniref:hypothetical protein n=1 Tax=Glutamicibacter arilaitensis TaxID=256701 RepID=UPI00384A7494
MKRIDQTRAKTKDNKRQVSSYGTQTPLSSAAVERGTTRWLNGSHVSIAGTLAVTGTATVGGTLSVTGILNASGQINLSGSTGITGPLNITGTTTIGGNTNITGELNVTGPTTLDGILDIGGDTTITGLLAVDGPTTISGTLDIQGITTVAADFEIIEGGLFKSGVTKIEPTGKATFGSFIIDPESPRLIQAPGGWLFSNGADDIGLSGSATSSVNLNSSRAELVYGNSSRVVASTGAIDLTATKTWVRGELEVINAARVPQLFIGTASEITNQRLRISGLPSIQGVQSNVYFNPANGLFFHIT